MLHTPIPCTVAVAGSLKASIAIIHIEFPYTPVRAVIKVQLAHATQPRIEGKHVPQVRLVADGSHSTISIISDLAVALAAKIIRRARNSSRPFNRRKIAERVGPFVSNADVEVGECCWEKR